MEKCACMGSFLDRFIQPSILLTLNREKMHGFSVYKKLIESDVIDYKGIDPTGLYRTLKKMEENGLLNSEWETDDTAKPVKVYSITEEGRHCLKNWQTTLSLYKKDIESLENAVAESLKAIG